MTTLGIMKARIIAETSRDGDLNVIPDGMVETAVEAEINSAIRFYRAKRFWFSEQSTGRTFNTSAGQSEYSGSGGVDIANIIRIDSITVIDNGQVYPLRLVDPQSIEIMINSTGALGDVPTYYSYYEQKLRFYPIPDGAYPIKIMGVYRVDAPASDSETDNPWMTDAEELIRFRAKRNLYLNWMLGTEATQAQAMKALEDEAYDRLRVETSSRSQVRRIRPSCL